MKQRNIIQRLGLFLLLIVTAAVPQAWGETMTISTKTDWVTFCNYVNSGYNNLDAALTTDIDLGTIGWWDTNSANEMIVGKADSPYRGTFDGNGHSITINFDFSGYSGFALFYYVEDATIRNVHTKGQLTARSNISGLVGLVYGYTTISGCTSEVDLTCAERSYSASSGGLVGTLCAGASLSIENCMVAGTFSSTLYGPKDGWGGFVGIKEGNCSCELFCCLYAGTNDVTGASYTFAQEADLKACYFLNPCGQKQGEAATTEQLESGEIAWYLDNYHDDKMWGQTIGTDKYPLLTSDPARKVYKVGFIRVEDNGNQREVAVRYVNSGQTVSLPTAQAVLGSSYDADLSYTLSFSDDFSESTAITANRRVIISVKETKPIATAADWKAFADLVNGGRTDLDATLVADIDLGTEITMVGTSSNPYSGIFDGGGHSITVDWTATGDYIAPFLEVSGGTIRNLRTKGQITSAYSYLSGMVINGNNLTLSHCSSEMNLTENGKNTPFGVGLICYLSGDNNVISDCIVTGTFENTTDTGKGFWAGFVHSSNGNCTMSNCLYVGTNNDYAFDLIEMGKINHDNCYAIDTSGAWDLGYFTAVTAEQLASGEVAQLLQNSRTDATYWAQVLGEAAPRLYREADKSLPNYLYYDTTESQWICDDVQITDGTSLPTGVDVYAKSATITRSMTAGKAYTITLPFAWREAGKAYTLTSVKDSVAHFQQVTLEAGKSYEAYKPYLFVPESDVTSISASDITIDSEPAQPMTENAGGIQWCATYEGLTNEAAANANAYILQGDGLFHKVTTDNTAAVIPPYRAYLTIPNASPGKKRLSIAFDNDNTTSLRAIETTDADGTVRYYDLQGRYIGTSLDGQPEGIYVGGGKKVIKK